MSEPEAKPFNIWCPNCGSPMQPTKAHVEMNSDKDPAWQKWSINAKCVCGSCACVVDEMRIRIQRPITKLDPKRLQEWVDRTMKKHEGTEADR